MALKALTLSIVQRLDSTAAERLCNKSARSGGGAATTRHDYKTAQQVRRHLEVLEVILGSTSREVRCQHAASLLSARSWEGNVVVQVAWGTQGGRHLPCIITAPQHHHCTDHQIVTCMAAPLSTCDQKSSGTPKATWKCNIFKTSPVPPSQYV